jgi:hypothetical protein
LNTEIEIIEEVEREDKNHKDLRLLEVAMNQEDSKPLSSFRQNAKRKESTLADYYGKKAAIEAMKEA